MNIFRMIYETYSAHVSEARDLEGDEEKAAGKESDVAFPVAGVVVGLKVDSLRHGPDSCSSHYYYYLESII